MCRFAAFAVLLCPTALSAADVDAARLSRIDDVVAASVQRNDCPGAVVLVVQGNEVVFRKAYGQRAKVPAAEAMTVDTVFDMASITKPVATATSVMILLERGQIRTSDKVAKHWPEFAANGKRDVTVEQCLLHTTGLTADNSINDYKEGRAKAVENVAKLSLEAPPGTRFRYSDVGFIVLGELVHRISGLPVNEFAAKEIYRPLKMADSGFNPKPSDRIAPTGLRDKKTIRGTVHDPRSFAMDGVAGHAGLFGTADDLAIYCRMLLNGGEVNGVRVLSPLTVRTFTQPHALPGGGSRSLGWDVDTSFAAQRGELFPAGEGFGHTGFTGTSIWVDPASKTAVIILTNRVHPDDRGNATELRRQVATVVASAIRSPLGIRNSEFGIRNGNRKQQSEIRNVLTGIDVLKKQGFGALKGKKVGLVTNHTGKDQYGNTTIDLIAKAEGVTLVSLFSPEHGIRGEKDEKVGDGKDEKTGLPVYSLYGERRKPTPEQLKGLDAIVYDIQDIGCRFYTYISTLKLVLQAGAEAGVPVIVLDRPNPLGGLKVEGPMLDPGRESFVGTHALPLRHGLTVGELSTLFNADSKTPAGLTVVKCEGWKRGDTFDRTNLTWRNPSPNMRHLTAAILYPGVGILETTNISVGRGTERPFEWVGAPWLDGAKLAAAMSAQNLPGVRFVPCPRTPVASVHKDKACGGIDILVTDWESVEPVRTGLTLATTLRSLYPKEWETKRLDTLLIHKVTFDGVVAGKSAAELERAWAVGLNRFKARRLDVLLYSE
jgi:uncharacterized protein YbbC (DUF1343 family)/CubicO group peptidase (beta-lactamase class C family)